MRLELLPFGLTALGEVRRRKRASLLLFGLLAAVMLSASCGGGFSISSGSTTGDSGRDLHLNGEDHIEQRVTIHFTDADCAVNYCNKPAEEQ